MRAFHLDRYLDEATYQYNTRKMADNDRFAQTVGRVKDKRITYDQLTGKGDGLRQG